MRFVKGTINKKLEHLTERELTKLIEMYVTNKATNSTLIHTFDINMNTKGRLDLLFPDIVTEYKCEYCDLEMIGSISSKSDMKYAESTYSMYSRIQCEKCGHIIPVRRNQVCECVQCSENRLKEIERAKIEKIQEENKKREFLRGFDLGIEVVEDLKSLTIFKHICLRALIKCGIDSNYKDEIIISGNKIDEAYLIPIDDVKYNFFKALIGTILELDIDKTPINSFKIKDDNKSCSYQPFNSKYKILYRPIKSNEEIINEILNIKINLENEETIGHLISIVKNFVADEILNYMFELLLDANILGVNIDEIISKNKTFFINMLDEFNAGQIFYMMSHCLDKTLAYCIKNNIDPREVSKRTINMFIKNLKHYMEYIIKNEYEVYSYNRSKNLTISVIMDVIMNDILHIGDKYITDGISKEVLLSNFGEVEDSI